MNTKEQLEKQIHALRSELNKILDAEDSALNKTYAGKFFKARNSYSCPKKPSDYWWIYIKVIDISDGIVCLSFQKDSGGIVSIDPRRNYMRVSLNEYQVITKKEWDAAACKCLGNVEALLST